MESFGKSRMRYSGNEIVARIYASCYAWHKVAGFVLHVVETRQMSADYPDCADHLAGLGCGRGTLQGEKSARGELREDEDVYELSDRYGRTFLLPALGPCAQNLWIGRAGSDQT